MTSRRTTLCILLPLLVAGVESCGDDSGANDALGSWLAESEAVIRPLGWLGGRAHPATRTVELPDPTDRSSRIVTGGLVLTEVLSGGPLAEAGVQRGDLLVRVGETWLPNKEDPSLDLIELVEAEVSAGTGSFEVGFLRGSSWRTVSLAHAKTPLQLGLPNASTRLAELARSGRERLRAFQQEKYCFSVPGMETDTATCALAGLAFLAGGSRPDDGADAEALASCRDRVLAAIRDETAPLDHWDLSLATIFLAELVGPLDVELPGFTIASSGGAIELPGEGVAFEMGELPEGAQVMTFSSEDELPEGLAELISGMGEGGEGGGVGYTIFTSAGEAPPGVELGGGGHEMPMAMTEGPLWALEQLAGLTGDETLPGRLADLERAVTRLVLLQQESGSWDVTEPPLGYSDATLATNVALLALGVAGRAGAPLDGGVIARALAHVRERTNDGHVFAVDEAGFDRRSEAGRACGAAAALRSLECLPTDEFLRELIEYGGKHGATIPEGRSAVPLHVLSRALVAFQGGLEARAVLFDELGPFLVSLAEPDGSFAPHASDAEEALGIDRLCADPATRTALYSLVAGLQADHLPLLTTRSTNPLLTPMNSEGERSVPPSGVLMGGGDQPDQEEVRRMLEGAGVDLEKLIRDARGEEEEDE